MHNPIRTVLFDLDGTLADTAPDLAYALNVVLENNGCEKLTYEQIRPVVSHGARALIERGFNLDASAPEFEKLRKELLTVYQNHLAVKTTVFPGMDDVLQQIEDRGLNWGVVTNKPAWLTEPLLDALNLTERAACIVSGDTLVESKPHPAPLLHACHLTGSVAIECVYVGDAERDIVAGRNAGMHTLVAQFGYIGEHDTPESWGADDLIDTPEGILAWLDNHLQRDLR
jgi:phosphoglycolate phosphatase